MLFTSRSRYEPLRQANDIVFGSGPDTGLSHREADFLISFGADFLETWISNVQFTRQFAAFHEPRVTGRASSSLSVPGFR